MGKGKKKKNGGPTQAEQADRHVLYERAVQEPEADVEFAIDTYRNWFGRRPHVLREDFCGTAAVCRDWVRAHLRNIAWGVDLDLETLNWGTTNNIEPLPKKERRRVALVHGDVRTVPTDPADVVMAQNFSYFLFENRPDLVEYFRGCHAAMGAEGMLLLDAYGGPESMARMSEETEYDDFSYVWDQDQFDPIRQRATCYIHFKFPDGSKMKRAFTYEWRMYTIPEVRDALREAGFDETRVYWEGTDPETEEGDGVYTEAETADNDAAWICYIAGFKK
ncbi:MAG: class I SAM-dependent methyltransferase [Acidobacteria bacterium]|nr:class I SAM-dependent methyltransferase [Acidobacteriota bacterium]